jgi:GTP pyrophosphokinase
MRNIQDSPVNFKEYLLSLGSGDRERMDRAMALASKKGDPGRALLIAEILGELNPDTDTLIAGLLLDTLEDGGINLETIEGEFGKNAAALAEGISRIGGIQPKSKSLQEAENIRKMLFAMVRDIRVIFIKLADRLSALRFLEKLPPEERKPAAQECLDIYAPLAGRLGISWIKDELEDTALKFLNPETYQQIKKIVAEKRAEREEFLGRIRKELREEAAGAGIGIEVSGRAKHFYSIYQKMRKRNKTPGDLFDLFGIRVLCDSVENCYLVLGLVHRLWKPLEGRFKDYLAMPKSNGYQSLHTTVAVFGGGPAADTPPEEDAPGAEVRMAEIQIRTREMHHVAEYGIASHWLYKRGSSRELIRPVDISVVNRLREWKQGVSGEEGAANSESFLEEIKREILKDSIYVFTPQGKVIELPAGASPIDFAYAVHSGIGDHCAGARAGGGIIPLGSALSNTQVVEILTSPQAHPTINWLRLVKTSKARSKIRAWLQRRGEIPEKTPAVRSKAAPAPEAPARPRERPGVQRVLRPEGESAGILHVRLDADRGMSEKNTMIRFARCCGPIPGDPITGYISRGRGVVIHRKNCPNLAGLKDLEERKIETVWEDNGLVKRFRIEARGSADLFSEIEGAVKKNGGRLVEGRLEERSPNRLTGLFTMQLESPEGLKGVMKNIRGIPGVYSIGPL